MVTLLGVFIRLAFHASFTFFAVLCVEFFRLRYDQFDADCDYHKEVTRGWLGVYVGSAFATLVIASLCDMAETNVLSISVFLLVCVAFLAAAAVVFIYNHRMMTHMRVLSARYMERKYGADFKTVMAIIEGTRSDAFPIPLFEEQLLLTLAQKKATVLEDSTLKEKAIERLNEIHMTVKAGAELKATAELHWKRGRWWSTDEQSLGDRLNALYNDEDE